ncbi:hypothetical protein [Manganibacter manganicus]|uniref:hypothetical protein n=1 Tax=Manganibacter manganicus TaxID=1873176 RepID=UPI001119C3DF|nr:hypothetical protein [Pseudaminobacter manganicus]
MMMNENFLNCGIFDWLSIAMISGTGFLAMLVLLSLLMALGRYILEGPADRFVHGGRSLDSNGQYPRDVVRNHGDETGVRSAIPIRDAPRCSGTAFEVPNPHG